ncbi:MAG: SDR family NAD(P)-dependent oxidoreductase, partial [Clostridia bacterium]|nr:SDR family NAD(P)-dependent oxidoreductase [Clostridia bacterium]
MKPSILITGAYGGMGKTTAKALKDKGFRVFALDRRVEAHEEDIIPIEADITSEESINRAFQKVSEMAGNLFAIIHFAGVYMLDSLV